MTASCGQARRWPHTLAWRPLTRAACCCRLAARVLFVSRSLNIDRCTHWEKSMIFPSASLCSRHASGSFASRSALPNRRCATRVAIQQSSASLRKVATQAPAIRIAARAASNSPASTSTTSTRTVGKHRCEFIEILRHPEPELTVVVVPGNPGLCRYYTEFLGFLAEQMSEACNLLCHGHLGHGAPGVTRQSNGKLFTLTDQVENHFECIRSIPGPVVLVGHSIGCHMALEAKKAMPDKVLGVVALQPFLVPNMSDSPQRAMKTAVGIWPLCVLVAGLVSLLHALPMGIGRQYVQRLALEEWSHHSTSAEVTCNIMIRYMMMRQYFHMGWTEFRDLSSSQHGFNARAQDLSEHSSSLGFVYSQDDHWAPLKHKQKLQAGLPGAFFCTLDAGDVDGKAITHDFVTTTHGSKHVADVACDMFCKIGVFSGIRDDTGALMPYTVPSGSSAVST